MIEQMKNNSYKVPPDYFEQLERTIKDNAHAMQREIDAQEQVAPASWRVQFRSAAGFAAAFVAIVVLAATGYYLTGHKAQQKQLAQNFDTMSLVYDLDEDEIMEYGSPSSRAQIQAQEVLVAQASIDYFETYGYPLAETLSDQTK